MILREICPSPVIHHVSTFHDIHQLLNKEQYQLCVLDINMPGGNNLQMIETIREKQKNCSILVFSAYEESNYALRFLRAGADGFLQKNADEMELKNALVSLINSGKYLSPSMLRQISDDAIAGKKTSASPMEILSDRELEVALLLIRGIGLTELSNTLNIQYSTACTYKSRLLEKLEVANTIELAELFHKYNTVPEQMNKSRSRTFSA